MRATTRFHLLVDEECWAFRRFGCYNEGPVHGLFLIDGAGVIRASYRGETPFSDVKAIADGLKDLTDSGKSLLDLIESESPAFPTSFTQR